MRFSDVLAMAMKNLWRRKLRSVLTILGVLIGVMSIVVMVSLGVGMQNEMEQQMNASDALTRIDVQGTDGKVWGPNGPETTDDQLRLVDETVEMIRDIPGVKAVHPILEIYIMAKHGSKEAHFSLEGVTPELLEEFDIVPDYGRLPDPSNESLELFAGKYLAMNFYDPNSYMGMGGDEPVDLMGDTVFGIFDVDSYWAPEKKVKKEILNFVGGQTENPEAEGYYDYRPYDNGALCYLDQLKAQLNRIFKGHAWPGQPSNKNGKPTAEPSYSRLIVRTNSLNETEEVLQTLRDLGLEAYSSSEYIQTMKDQLQTTQLIFAGIGGVSLLVAAIGIMNTMIMSIYERTKEIGIFKVLGCDMGRIRDLFLTEAALIGFVGGVLGIAGSYGISHLINSLTAGDEMLGAASSGGISQIPLWLVGLAVGFAILVGIISGLVPALRAMRLSPLQALHDE